MAVRTISGAMVFLLLLMALGQAADQRWEIPAQSASAALPKLADDLKLDGDFADWAGAAAVPLHFPNYIMNANNHTWNGPADAGLEVLCGWNSEGLCLAGFVADDDIRNNKPPELSWQQDCVEVFVDGRVGKAFMQPPYSAGAYQLFVRPPAGGKPAALMTNPAHGKIENAKVAGKIAEGGWTFELVIPWSNFPGFTPQAGSAIGLQFALDDSDSRDKDAVQPLAMSWRGATSLFNSPQKFIKWNLTDKMPVSSDTPLDALMAIVPESDRGFCFALGSSLSAKVKSAEFQISDWTGKAVGQGSAYFGPQAAPWANSAAGSSTCNLDEADPGVCQIKVVLKDDKGSAIGNASQYFVYTGWSELGVHPSAAQQKTQWGKTIQTIFAYDGRLYLGYGDGDANTGPIDVVSFDPTTKAFTKEWTSMTECISVYRSIFGKLYAPAIDPRGAQPKAAGFAEGSCGTTNMAWSDNSVFMEHGFDMTTLTGTDLWLVGSHGDFHSVAMRSLDQGKTWSKSLDLTRNHDPRSRFYFACALNSKLYVQSSSDLFSMVFDGKDWNQGPDISIDYECKAQIFAGRIVLVAGQSYSGKRLLECDGVNHATPVRSIGLINDFTIAGNLLYAVQRDGVILRSADLKTWEKVADNIPKKLTSLAVFNGKLYAGTAESKLYEYRKSVSDLPSVVVFRKPDADDKMPGKIWAKRFGDSTSALAMTFSLRHIAEAEGESLPSQEISITIPAGEVMAELPLPEVFVNAKGSLLIAIVQNSRYDISAPGDLLIAHDGAAKAAK